MTTIIDYCFRAIGVVIGIACGLGFIVVASKALDFVKAVAS